MALASSFLPQSEEPFHIVPSSGTSPCSVPEKLLQLIHHLFQEAASGSLAGHRQPFHEVPLAPGLTYLACLYPLGFIIGDSFTWLPPVLRCDKLWLPLPGKQKTPNPFIPGLRHCSAGPRQSPGAGQHHLPGQDQQDHPSAELKQPRMHYTEQQVLGLKK